VGSLFSPKMLILFLVNHKIIQGANAEINGVEQLFILLKSLIKDIVDVVKGKIVSILLELVMREITNLQKNIRGKVEKELVVNKTKALLSLTGVNQETIRLLSNF
jgi:hypothetical protein